MKAITTLVLTLAAATLVACKDSAPQSATPPTPVRVEQARSGPAAPVIATNGLVVLKDEMRLSFKVGGVIRRIAVEEGQAVQAGARLAEIELTEVNSQVEQARQMADKAQRDLARGERLHKDEVISLEQLQDLRTQAAVARAQLGGAQFNRGYAVIVAPQDGVVLRKLAQERELVPAGEPVIVLGASDRGFIVKAALADRDVVQVRLGDTAAIHVDAFPGKNLAGRVSEISGASDDKTGLFPIEVRLTDAPSGAVSGLVARLEIQPASAAGPQLTYVPIAAVVEGDGDRASVYILRDNKAVRREVRIAFIAPENVALRAGVAAGETVVTDGALYLQDGESIAVVNDAALAVGSTQFPPPG